MSVENLDKIKDINPDVYEIIKPPQQGDSFLQSVQDEAQSVEYLCEDHFVNSGMSEIGYSESKLGLWFFDDQLRSKFLTFTQHSFAQLCTKLGVPVRYALKCLKDPDTANTLLLSNLNTWREKLNKQLFVREYNNTVRGILSTRYSALDTVDILDVLQNTVDPTSFKVKGHYVSSERFHLRFAECEMLPVSGEDLFLGIQIDSSDVGRSTLVAQIILYKQVCTNGMVVQHDQAQLFKQRHLGITKDVFHTEFQDAIQNISRVKDSLCAVINIARHDEKGFNVDKEEERIKLLEISQRILSLKEDDAHLLLDTMSDRYDRNRWGFANAITDHAQRYSLERRLELEQVASDILYQRTA